MKAIYNLDDPFWGVNTLEELKNAVEEFHASIGVNASVAIDGESVVAEHADRSDIDAEEDTRIIVSFCNSRRFGKAHKVLGKLLSAWPGDDNAHRLLAQVLMEEEKFDAAIKECEIALKLNPRNEFSMILMGNLLSRDKGNPEEGIGWYKRAMEVNPNSVLAICNYAGILLQRPESDKKEVERLFLKAKSLDPTVLNVYMGLVFISMERHDSWSVFNFAQEGLRAGMSRPENPAPIRHMLLDTVLKVVPTLCEKGISPEVMARIKSFEDEFGTPVKLDSRDDIQCPMVFERAENHRRDFHVLAYNSNVQGYDLNHLILLELEKSECHYYAKRIGRAKRVATGEEHYQNFKSWTQPHLGSLAGKLSDSECDAFLRNMHRGLVSQLMNCVPDALAEWRIFQKHPKMRPGQFLGDFKFATDIVRASRVGKTGDLPQNIVRASRVMGLFTLLAYRNTVGVEMFSDVDAPFDERRLASGIFDEFQDVVKDYTPGDEWKVTASIARKLELEDFCEFIADDDKLDLLDAAIKAKSLLAEREEEKIDASNGGFLENLKNNPSIGMSVMFFMMEAIKELRGMPKVRVAKIAFQIATMGIAGISPGQENGYCIAELPGKDMSGCQALAWYYASWRIAFPEKMASLEQGMPFAEQYLMAVKMLEGEGGK